MNYLTKNYDKENVFYEDEVEKARIYWGVEEECEDLYDVAKWWNMHHSGDDEGELVVQSFQRYYIVDCQGNSWGDFSTRQAAESSLYNDYSEDTIKEKELEIIEGY